MGLYITLNFFRIATAAVQINSLINPLVDCILIWGMCRIESLDQIYWKTPLSRETQLRWSQKKNTVQPGKAKFKLHFHEWIWFWSDHLGYRSIRGLCRIQGLNQFIKKTLVSRKTGPRWSQKKNTVQPGKAKFKLQLLNRASREWCWLLLCGELSTRSLQKKVTYTSQEE